MKHLLVLTLLTTSAFANPHKDHGWHNPYTTKARAEAVAVANSASNASISSKYTEAASSAMVDGGTCSGSLAIQLPKFGIGSAKPDSFCRLITSAKEDLNMAARMTCPGSRDTKSSVELPDACVQERERLYSQGKLSLELAREVARKKPGFLGRIWAVIGT